MLSRRIYYEFKPLLPQRLRFAVRRHLAQQKRKECIDTWPIDPQAKHPPKGWPGWPDKKRFAVVLTHDVEGPDGVEKCKQLAELEMSLGFRSSFNFIPEGPYKVTPELRSWLIERGFEVGIHDLHHDGKLFRNRKTFAEKAARINDYLKEWNAVGFRAGLMHNNLEWQHDIKAEYDASTFDTDPFEPFPFGARTIFPYWVKRKNGDGYVELPYTMPQDSTLFLIFREKSMATWATKLDWVAEQGGMALVNVHPDYIDFGGRHTGSRFPISYYADLLRHVKEKPDGQYWHALPRDVAKFARENRDSLEHRWNSPPRRQNQSGVKIWIDLENTPHIPFFNPIIKELEKRGHTIVLTARDAYQTCEMADMYGLKYRRIGKHFGKRIAFKAVGLGLRILQLIPFVLKEKPALAVNHGARAQTAVCDKLGIPNVLIMDYEHSSGSGLGESEWKIYPEVVASERQAKHPNPKLLSYSGIKEDVYVSELKPDARLLKQLKLEGASVVITVRPPAVEAHYHNPEAEILFTEFMNRAVKIDGAKVVLLPRNKRQEAQIREQNPSWFSGDKVVIPDTVVDGLNLLWHSDLVVSGGGTMNREAAALGVPVYSIFRGTIGAVDHYLQANGRLILVESVDDVHKKIKIERRVKDASPDSRPRQALADIVNHIEDIIKLECQA